MSKCVMHLAFGKRFLAVAVLLGAGYLAGVASREATVQADVRRDQSEPEHFQTGSEVLLREISGTLTKMDSRIERLEKLATQFAARSGPASVKETR